MKEVVLSKNLGYLQINNTGAQPEIGPTTYNMGTWKKSLLNIFYMEEEIDIAGLTKQELTFFPISGDVQRGATSVGQTGGYSQEWIFVTANKINPQDLAFNAQFMTWNVV